MPTSKSESEYDRPSDAEMISTYQQRLKSMERSLDLTDRRKYTSSAISAIEFDLREVIRGLSQLREQPIRRTTLEFEPVLVNLRRAQNELYIAMDMLEAKSKFTESNRRSFYKCLNNFQEYLFEALRFFY